MPPSKGLEGKYNCSSLLHLSEFDGGSYWQGAPRLPEFIIRVYHPDPEHARKVSFHLHVKYVRLPFTVQVSCIHLWLIFWRRLPKTYPTIASPIFNIQQPIVGLKPDQVTKILHAIREEAQRNRGVEIVFQVRLVAFVFTHAVLTCCFYKGGDVRPRLDRAEYNTAC